MRRLGFALMLIATAAFAGEAFIGRILVSDAGSTNNAATGYGSAGCAATGPEKTPGACDQAFYVPTNSKLTIQCDEAAIIGVNVNGVDAGNALVTSAGVMLPTSTGDGPVFIKTLPDGGSYSGGLVSIAPAVGAVSARCRVFLRSGKE